ncbi:Alpha/Beta hydrolase protein [Ilyonectria destructans]|nr:Alpha/Beta hydrolase protein [Ilyonectria destructans]
MSADTSQTNDEGLVRGAGKAHLCLYASGSPRRPGQPVVIFEAGLGVSSASWAATQRLLNGHVRSYRYDRAGYGLSPASSMPRTAANMAAELLEVLRAAGVGPPYILVAHSYGGIIVREFMAAAGPEAIAGMVLVDANQEKTHRKLDVPFDSNKALCGGRSYFDIIGLMRENSFTPEELGRIALDDTVPTAASTAENEQALLFDSSDALGARNQLDTQPLGMRPVTVIRGDASRDFRRLLAAAQTDRGLATERGALEDFLAHRFNVFDHTLQMQQLRLSANGRFVQATRSGHAVVATEPELIAEEILSVWQSSTSHE